MSERTVLIVEDEPFVAEDIALALEKMILLFRPLPIIKKMRLRH
jgi:hypothetical protein